MWATDPATHVDRTAATERRVGRRRVARQIADGVVYAADRGATHMDRTDVTGRRVVRGRYRRATVARQGGAPRGLLSGDQSIKTAINVVVLSVTPW